METKESQAHEITVDQADDFKLIHGIGPGVENRLHAAGISTYSQLAAMTPEQVVLSLGKMIGLTTKRVVDQEWIEQARALVSASPIDQSAEPMSRQHYATFTVELLLDEKNNVRRTQTVHIQTKVDESWAGWEEARLVEFIKQHAGLSTAESETLFSPSTELVEVIEEESTVRLSGSPRLGELRVISLTTGNSGRILSRQQPFEIRLVVDMTGLDFPGVASTDYEAQFFAKILGSGTRQKIGEAHGSFYPVETVEMTVQNSGLKEGVYRISVDLALKYPSVESSTYAESVTPLDGGLIQVY